MTTILTPLRARVTAPVLVEFGCLVVIFGTFAWLADLFPYSGDDWAWGSQIGLDRLGSLFQDYNGRYAGNLAVLALTRSSALAALTMAATVTGLSFLILHLARFRTLVGYVVVYALILAMPIPVWRQGIAWTSGFSNYSLATLSMLTVLAILRWLLMERPTFSRGRGIALGAMLFVLTFIGQLFIEHVTTFIVLVTTTSIVYSFYRGRHHPLLWSLFAGAVLGAAAMFSNGAYRRALSGEGNYQRIGQSAGSRVDQMLDAVDSVIGLYGVISNTALNVTLLALLAIVAFARFGRLGRNEGRGRLAWAGVGCFATTGAGLLLAFANDDSLSGVSGFVGVLALLVVLGTAGATVTDRSSRTLVVLVAAAFLVLVLPLLVVKPIGPRCFVPTYAILLVAVAMLTRHAVRDVRSPNAALVAIAAAILAISTFGSRYSAYADINHASAIRQAKVKAAVESGRRDVSVRPLPDGATWVHYPDPASEPWNTRYKLFYGVPKGVSITVK